jgi:hypothetical protein
MPASSSLALSGARLSEKKVSDISTPRSPSC